ncbi:hypothetical protein HanRHA438_Chr12g0575901 [Helianthus annuus]|nr:hypothetical protein HanRHA438_Chr12g0575901 [Helianthus annuus]
MMKPKPKNLDSKILQVIIVYAKNKNFNFIFYVFFLISIRVCFLDSIKCPQILCF